MSQAFVSFTWLPEIRKLQKVDQTKSTLLKFSNLSYKQPLVKNNKILSVTRSLYAIKKQNKNSIANLPQSGVIPRIFQVHFDFPSNIPPMASQTQ